MKVERSQADYDPKSDAFNEGSSAHAAKTRPPFAYRAIVGVSELM
jgi:hypothetical protein